MEHRAEDSAPAKMDMGIVGHSMIGHDMSDPAMAGVTEADMRVKDSPVEAAPALFLLC
jgi:hypothetical protein